MATVEMSSGSSIQGSLHGPYTINGNETSLVITVAHGLGMVPTAVHVQPYGDLGAMTILTSINSWDATNVAFVVRNLSSLAEIVYFSIIAL
jgi:hypothetical protein